ncbi:MAG: FtsX-like permease family protein [archaeon]
MTISEESIKYSLKNIAHRKTRSALTIFSILIGITTMFIFISFGWGLYDYVNSFTSGTSADKITIQPKGIGAPGMDDAFSLTKKDLKAVERSVGVFEAEGLYMKVIDVKKDDVLKYVMFSSQDPKKNLGKELMNVKLIKGRELQSGDVKKVVLGYSYLLENKVFPKGLDINDKITLKGEDFRVVGFYSELGNPQDDSNIYILPGTAEALYPNMTGYAMIIGRADIKNMNATLLNVERNLRISRGVEKGKEDFYVASFEDLIKTYMSALDIVIGFVILIALISVLVSAINTSNTMITSVIERTKEIGIIKSIGAKNSEIFNIFLFESGFLGFIAGVLGVLFGGVLTFIAGKTLDTLGWGFLSPHYSYSLFIGCILFATVTGAISGVIPAINASRTNIVDALRYE